MPGGRRPPVTPIRQRLRPYEHATRISLRYPATAATCFALLVGGWLTGTTTGQAISRATLARLGYAPRDILALDLWRLLGSALVTHGGLEFWTALAATALFLGLAEKTAGTKVALAGFWGAHAIALVAETALIATLHVAGGSRLATLVYFARDVGPSAGYFGALGLGLAVAKPRWARAALFAVGAILLTLLAKTLLASPVDADQLSADLAHVIALPAGAMIALAGRAVSSRRARTASARGR